jgi:hypothetical protein
MSDENKAHLDSRFDSLEHLILELSTDRRHSNASEESTRTEGDPSLMPDDTKAYMDMRVEKLGNMMLQHCVGRRHSNSSEKPIGSRSTSNSTSSGAKAYLDIRLEDREKLIIEISHDRRRSYASREPTRSEAEPQEAGSTRDETWQDLSAIMKRQVDLALVPIERKLAAKNEKLLAEFTQRVQGTVSEVEYQSMMNVQRWEKTAQTICEEMAKQLKQLRKDELARKMWLIQMDSGSHCGEWGNMTGEESQDELHAPTEGRLKYSDNADYTTATVGGRSEASREEIRRGKRPVVEKTPDARPQSHPPFSASVESEEEYTTPIVDEQPSSSAEKTRKGKMAIAESMSTAVSSSRAQETAKAKATDKAVRKPKADPALTAETTPKACRKNRYAHVCQKNQRWALHDPIPRPLGSGKHDLPPDPRKARPAIEHLPGKFTLDTWGKRREAARPWRERLERAVNVV